MQTQFDFTGHPRPATGNRVRNELAQIMEAEPETIDNEDLLAAKWLDQQGLIPWFEDFPITLSQVALIIGYYRRANLRARRQELRHLYPYSPEEEARRQARGRGGPPG